MDTRFSLKVFADQIGVTFPLLSDFKRDVSKAYGVYNEANGAANRTTLVVNKEGIITYIEQGRTAVDIAGAKKACEALP